MKENLRAFFKDFDAGTVQHPLVSYQRLWMGAVIPVTLEVTAHYGQVYLRRIWASHAGRGYGTECLRWLLGLIKKHGVVMIGHASRPSDLAKDAPGPGAMVLRRWYRRFGARFDRHGACTFTAEGVKV